AQHFNDPNVAQSASTVVRALFDQNNIDRATTWMSQMPSGEARNQAETTIAYRWAAKDPSSAARWLATLPANEQTNGATAIARNWVESNWPDASRWIETLTGEVRDDAVVVATEREGATQAESL